MACLWKIERVLKLNPVFVFLLDVAACFFWNTNNSWTRSRTGYATEIRFSSGGSQMRGQEQHLPQIIRLSVGHLRMDDFCIGGYEGLQPQASYCRVATGHTGCRYRTVDAPTCGTIVGRKISAAEKKTILDNHNAKRRRVALGQETRGVGGGQPGAANMIELSWDDEAAAVAQLWADQCTFSHDFDRRTIAGGTITSGGQNIYVSFSQNSPTSAAWNFAIDAWYNEVDKWKASYVNSYPGGITASESGHYSQLVWATTSKIGCGYIAYKQPTDPSYRRLYICNYMSAGNMLGLPVYRAGSNPCSNCPSGYAKCNSGLCAP